MNDLRRTLRLARRAPPRQLADRAAVWQIATALVFVALAVFLVTETQWSYRPSPVAQTPGRNLRNELVDLGDHTLGDGSMASVGVVEFGDFECPFCGQFFKAVEPLLVREYVKPGRIVWAFRQFPLEGIHANARLAASVAECAGEEGRFWEAHDFVYDHQADLVGAIGMLASALRLDEKRFAICMAGPAARVDRDLSEAGRLGLGATPTFLMGTLVGTQIRVKDVVVGLPPPDRLRARIDQTLRDSQRPGSSDGR
jgi:protein-disulfide isomerase